MYLGLDSGQTIQHIRPIQRKQPAIVLLNQSTNYTYSTFTRPILNTTDNSQCDLPTWCLLLLQRADMPLIVAHNTSSLYSHLMAQQSRKYRA